MDNIKKDLKIDVDAVIESKSKTLARYIPKFVKSWLKKIIHQDELNEILKNNKDAEGADFAQKTLNYLNVKCNIKYVNKDALKKNNRYIFVSNHPLGGLDGLVLISEIGKDFGDIKFIVNDLLMHIEPLKPIFVPVNKHGKMGKLYGNLINEAYASNSQILYFPAGLCSRLINGEITDLEWKRNFLKQAIKYNRDIVPIFFSGQNSRFFYKLAKWRKFFRIKFNFEMIFLPDEMIKQKNTTFEAVIGEPILINTIDNSKTLDQWSADIRRKCYNLKKYYGTSNTTNR